MAEIQWHLRGTEFAACNCDWGCPCQFNSLPTHGDCQAVVGMRIEDGEFAGTRLDGLCWVGTFAWPGAIHQGHGRAQVFVDERASDAQRDAILAILSGAETDPGATIFQVFSTVIEQMHEPQRAKIEFDVDIDARTGHIVVPGVVESRGEPIRNPITGLPHRARLTLPEGFEYDEAEFGCSSFTATGAVAIASNGGHAHFARIDMNRHGVVR